ncbi:hypothetical protein FQB35_02180 [Crassaminicella thermophila]|uniref:Uncharacterized protein n=1 Tax=Crassaminicella thermophila TaxID=2599308 RepID=A0A5C0SAR9_CRATE|nr:hypothetical protein FQB35_02180 [Crassaminicella thermophila]
MSFVFGPQKGATEEMIKILDKNLTHYGQKIKEYLGKDIVDVPGAGAAGGLGAGLMAFLDGKLKNGIQMVISYTKLEEKVKSAHMVWTGEGSIDQQTIYGKTPFGVAQVANKLNIHRNTLNYRLEKIYELTGKHPKKLLDLMELVVGIVWKP